MESFKLSLELLQASHTIKCNIIFFRICLSIPKYSPIHQPSTQNTSSINNDFEDFKSNFIETFNVQTEIFMNQKKELSFTEMNLLKNELLTSLKFNTSLTHANLGTISTE